MSTRDDLRVESYRDEVDEIRDRDDDLARIVSWRGTAESEAAGVRSLEDYAPASGLWYGADVIARATSQSSAGGANASGRGGGHPCKPLAPNLSPDDAVTPSSPSPVEASCPDQPRRGEGSDESEAA